MAGLAVVSLIASFFVKSYTLERVYNTKQGYVDAGKRMGSEEAGEKPSLVSDLADSGSGNAEA